MNTKMTKKVIVSAVLMALCFAVVNEPLVAQEENGERNNTIRHPMLVDTTSTVFKEVYRFWCDYKQAQMEEFVMRNRPHTLKTADFWAKEELTENPNPDMILQSIYPPFAFMNEEFLGVSMRNDTLYELQTIFYSHYPVENTFEGVFTVPVVKTQDGYKLINKLTLNMRKYKTYQIGWLTFYYPYTYPFDEEKAKESFNRANKVAKELGIVEVTPIKYFLYENQTELLHGMGVDGSIIDFNLSNNIIHYGHSLWQNRKVDFTQGGEGIIHELLHVFIYDLRKNNNGHRFDEGVCCYFGDNVNFTTNEYQLGRLKEFLNDNPQINLSVNLAQGYKDVDGHFTNDSTASVDGLLYGYGDSYSNHLYNIQVVICEMLYKKGGMELVKRMLFETKRNEDEYEMIEMLLGVKREEVNGVIREYLREKY